MYVRFVVPELDSESEREQGIFQAIVRLHEDGDLSPEERERLEVLRDWFNNWLDKPARFTASKPPYYRKQQRAISWFKDSAKAHIAVVFEMVAILRHHGIHVTMLKAERVGYVVYEDDYQIVAEPFADTLT
ncbi:hypothetical protein SAMN05421770_101300 [Granulicella rosea]|uniref:Uncharacterized protein n=1 Tax=Granulicella rosea TaxID=474952 RepID=A0A239D6Q3_9BACT|nr:hypothetical protein [Granulicella rosea]SNS27544.1 hypothetical protein SAMN05421770_101300 [Granulicella rosea]